MRREETEGGVRDVATKSYIKIRLKN